MLGPFLNLYRAINFCSLNVTKSKNRQISILWKIQNYTKAPILQLFKSFKKMERFSWKSQQNDWWSFGQLFDFLHLLNNYGYIQILIFLVFMIDYNFGLDLVAIRPGSRELWPPKVPGQFRDNFGTPTWESREKEPFGCSLSGVAQRILYGGRWWLPPSPGRGVSRGPKCPWLVPTPKGVPECELTTWVVCFDADSCLIY
jgi:hypothetical protein